jgi:hypothetical protein
MTHFLTHSYLASQFNTASSRHHINILIRIFTRVIATFGSSHALLDLVLTSWHHFKSNIIQLYRVIIWLNIIITS